MNDKPIVSVGATALFASLVISVSACARGGQSASVTTSTAAPARLVVLHTNDNWGETKPCG